MSTITPPSAAILPGPGALKPAVGTAMLVVTAGLVAILLYHGLGIQRASAVFAVAIMGTSALYGFRYGLVATLLCVVATHFFTDTPDVSLRLDPRQVAANAVMFGAAAWLASTFTKVLRESRDDVRLLYEGGVLSGRFGGSEMLADRSPREFLAREALRLAAMLLLVSICAAMAVELRRRGVEQVSVVLLAGVVAGALFFGARYAIVGAVAAILALNAFIIGPAAALDLTNPHDLLNLTLFLGCAAIVGGYTDRVRHERAAVRLVLSAGEQLAGAASEAEIRQLLCDTVSRAGGGVPTLVVGPDGKVLERRLVDAPPQNVIRAGLAASAHQTVRLGPWRVRRLDAGEDTLGAVAWRGEYRRAPNAKALDSTIGAFVDRCGGAQAQMRLVESRADTEVMVRTERLRNALLASVSHDFRTPLAGILGASTSLLEFPNHNSEIAHDMLATIKAQAQRLNRYMENLIRAARLEDGAIEVRLTRCFVWECVADAWEDFAEGAGSDRLFDLQGAPDICATADPVLLRQVIANVLENALKFSPPGSTITARVLIGLINVVVDITDEGEGVPEEQRERIFDRFYRGPDTTTGGTGLGLYICRILMDAQGGSIEALPRPDERSGLLVRIILPLDGVII